MPVSEVHEACFDPGYTYYLYVKERTEISVGH